MKKILCASIAVLLAAGCSAGGAGSAGTEATNTTSEDANYVFTSDLQTLDWHLSQNATDAQITSNLVDGLTEINKYNNYVGALAESWEHNEDSTVWTFHLRDAKWVTNTEEEYADVTAEDFVNGVRHLSDFQGATIAIAESYVKGLAEYGKSERTDADWDKVGIKALDDKTVEYTLTDPTPFFHTVVANNSFWPVNKEFLESKGDGCKLGSPDPTNCGYGKATDSSSILYNGAYILDEVVSKSSQKMHKNEQYWDAEHVYIQNVNRVFDDGSDPASTVKGFESESNPYYQATLLTTAKDFESYLEQYKEYAFNPQQNGYTFGINFNFNRTNFDNSSKTKAQQADTKKALLNTHFRKALKYGFDRVSYMGTIMDKTIAEKVIRTLETPWNFVSTSDGKSYGELVQAASEDPSMCATSMTFGVLALLLAYCIAIPAGMLMASHKGKAADHIGTVWINFMIAVPSLAFIFFGRQVFYLLGFPTSFPSLGAHNIKSYIPAIVILALMNTGSLMLWTRRYMLDQSNADYVKFARAKGLSQSEIFKKHILRNAVIPIVHDLPASIILTITGAVLTETVFAIPGTGKLLPDAINEHNNAMIVALTILYTSLSIFSVLIGDLLMTVVDPRIKLTDDGGAN